METNEDENIKIINVIFEDKKESKGKEKEKEKKQKEKRVITNTNKWKSIDTNSFCYDTQMILLQSIQNNEIQTLQIDQKQQYICWFQQDHLL